MGIRVTGSSFADTIIGGSGEGYISGGAGADTIIGGESNDVIDGGAGADTIVCYSSEVIYDGSDISIDGGGERSTLIVDRSRNDQPVPVRPDFRRHGECHRL